MILQSGPPRAHGTSSKEKAKQIAYTNLAENILQSYNGILKDLNTCLNSLSANTGYFEYGEPYSPPYGRRTAPQVSFYNFQERQEKKRRGTSTNRRDGGGRRG